MVHELLGLNKNRVSLADAPGIKDDLKEVGSGGGWMDGITRGVMMKGD